jgi:eukaryotic-like serine/threonine-protein kinase
MATVHCGCLVGPAGFSRTVAIKRLHAAYAKDPEFVAMFLDEARLAARIRHPNVVPTLDVVAREGELFLVMDYVQGESLARLVRASSAARQPIPVEIVSSIVCSVLLGLHAAHEATNDQGEPLSIVHRDVSPQNVLVGSDGVARVLDFGVAKAAGSIHTTRDGQVKGKLAYMAPEQLRAGTVDRRTDVFAVGILLWEALTLERLFSDESEGRVVTNVLERPIPRPSASAADLPKGLDEVVLRALERKQAKRYATAREMANAVEACIPMASPTRVAAWVEGLVGEVLAERARTLARIESDVGSAARPDEGTREHDVHVEASEPHFRTGLSQVSSILVSTSGQLAKVPIDRRWWMALIVAGFLCVLVVWATLTGWGRVWASPPALAATTNQPPPAVEVQTTAVPVPSASIAVTAPPLSASPSEAVARPPRAAAPPSKPCTVQSYFDSSGFKHFVKVCK